MKEPRYPRPLLISQEIPGFVNGGKRARETSTLLNEEEGEWEEGNGGLEVRKRPRKGRKILETMSLCFLWCNHHPDPLPSPFICLELDMIAPGALRQAASPSQLWSFPL